jgi:regulator of sigma E protease
MIASRTKAYKTSWWFQKLYLIFFKTFELEMFWTIALLSIMLGVMNLLPIPALMMIGHLMFYYTKLFGLKNLAINSREHN